MATLPAATDFTGASITEAQFKTAITDLRTFLADQLGTAGTVAAALATLGALGAGVAAKSAGYTVVAADRGKLLDCTNTITLSLTAAATLASGFSFAVRNSGTGTVTVDPNSTEQIDGASTLDLEAGESCVIVCDGSAFKTVGLSGATGILAQTVLTSGTSHSLNAATTHVVAEAVAGGGGGNAGARGGGGQTIITNLLAKGAGSTVTYTIGGGGAGSSGSTGGDGTDTTVTINGTTFTADGGVGANNSGGTDYAGSGGYTRDANVGLRLVIDGITGGASTRGNYPTGTGGAGTYGSGGSVQGNGGAGLVIITEYAL